MRYPRRMWCAPLLGTVLTVIGTGWMKGEVVAVADPGENLAYQQTVIWTPLFQAAWDGLNDGLGVPLKIDPPNALMNRLDHFDWKAHEVMPANRWKVWAGEATQKLIDRANTEAAAMIGEEPFHIEPRASARIALGLLDRDLIFKKPLHASVDAPLIFHATDGTEFPARFFGTRRKASNGYGGVVGVLGYEKDTFALEILSDGDDAAILYRPEKPMGFNDACAKMREWRKRGGPGGEYGSVGDPGLHENDDVRIPVLKLVNTTNFVPQLEGSRYYQNGPPWVIYKAEQQVKFQLTEKGAKLRAQVEMGAIPLGAAPPPPPMIPRFFHFDRPFFVFLWRGGAQWPYFGAWIGGADAMEEFKSS